MHLELEDFTSKIVLVHKWKLLWKPLCDFSGNKDSPQLTQSLKHESINPNIGRDSCFYACKACSSVICSACLGT